MEGTMMNGAGAPVRTTPKDFFIQIGILITLYVSAGALLALLFAVINVAMPDALLDPRYIYRPDYSGTMRFSVSTLIVSFPLYLILGWIFNRDTMLVPEKRDLLIRRWLTYLTLFVAGAVVAGDLVFLVYSFLGGEITSRFILKVLAVLVVAGLIFTYYILDTRRVIETKKLYKTFALISIILVIASIVTAFIVMGSPMTQRKVRFDDRRVSDLNGIQWQVVNHWQRTGSLPKSLNDLKDPISSYMIPQDPETNKPYVYELVSNASSSPRFKLCADFALESRRVDDRRYDTTRSMMYYDNLPDAENWKHEAGYACFDRTIDPLRYPQYEKPVPVRQ